VDGMVRLLNTNRTTFSALFKRHTGGSFLSYLIRLRVGKAAVLLRETELPVKEILYQTGFTDPTHFSRCFKKITGLNPGAYRASRRRPVTQIPGGRETGLIAAG
jgi:two-component system response regulator YesN